MEQEKQTPILDGSVQSTDKPAEGDKPSGGGESAWEPKPLEGMINPAIAESFPKIGSFKTVDDMAAQVAKQDAEIGRLHREKGVALPGEDATPEEVLAFKKEHFGGVTEPDEYQVPEGIEGLNQDDPMLAWFRDAAARRGLSQNDFTGMLSEFQEFRKGFAEQTQQQVELQTRQQLAEVFGANVNEALAKANAMLNSLPDDLKGVIKEQRGYDVVLTRILAHAYDRYGEGAGLQQKAGGAPAPSAEETWSKIQEINRQLKDRNNFNKRGELRQKKAELLKQLPSFPNTQEHFS